MQKKKAHGNSRLVPQRRLVGAIRAHRGNLSAVARQLKVERKTVYDWLEKGNHYATARELMTEVRRARR